SVRDGGHEGRGRRLPFVESGTRQPLGTGEYRPLSGYTPARRTSTHQRKPGTRQHSPPLCVAAGTAVGRFSLRADRHESPGDAAAGDGALAAAGNLPRAISVVLYSRARTYVNDFKGPQPRLVHL